MLDLLLEQVRRTPQAVAVVDGDRWLTYEQLWAAVTRYGAGLRELLDREQPVPAERAVAVVLPQSIELVVATIAVVWAGAHYVPLDGHAPTARNLGAVSGTQAAVLITKQPESELAIACRDRGIRVLVPDPEPGAHPEGAEQATTHPDQLLYVIHTSGSTGSPKPAGVTHRAMAALVADPCWAVDPKPVVLLHSPYAFDAFAYELWLPLLTGGRIVVAGPDAQDPGVLGELCRRHSVTSILLTAGLFTVLADEDPTAFEGLRLVWTGGDVVSANSAITLLRACPGVAVAAAWGTTETTVISTWFPITTDSVAEYGVAIGQPMAGVQVRLLDDRLRPVPQGEPGEAYIAGPGVGRGFVGQPALTAERFVADPYASAPGSRMYRTGDLLRHRSDGNLAFVGRADVQVKIRGFRVEPAEVEAVLAGAAGVGQVAVVAHGRAGSWQLSAYLSPAVGATDWSANRLRSWAAARLPDYLVPATFTLLDRLPLTSNGKLDRTALPAPVVAGSGGAPTSDTEKLLVDLFSQLLEVSGIGVEDDFFQLGGHSLTAVRLTNRVQAASGVKLPSAALFSHRTPAALAELIEHQHAVEAPLLPELRALDHGAETALSAGQTRLWFTDRIASAGSAYHVPLVIDVTGPLHRPALARALADVAGRHEPLRTTYGERDGTPYQRVTPDADVVFRERVVTPAALDTELAAAVREPFDLAVEPPFRATVFFTGPETSTLLIALHHIAVDGASVPVLADDLATAYRARLAGRAPQWPPLPVGYRDYACWQRELLGGPDDRSAIAREELAYWRGQLAGAPEVLDLPFAKTRPAEPDPAAGTVTIELSAEVHAGLLALARTEQTTVFCTMHAAFAGLLTRLGAGTDLPIGTVTAGRTHPDLEPLVGFFVNTLTLRLDTAGNPTLRELIARARQADEAAYAHQLLPFDAVVTALNPTRDGGHHPLFQIALILQSNAQARFDFEQATSTLRAPRVLGAQFDLTCNVVERDGGGLTLEFEYALALFEADQVAVVAECFGHLLADWADAPDTPLADAPLLTARLHDAAVERPNDTAQPPTDATLVALITEHARRSSSAIAVECDGERVSYAELDRWSDAAAVAIADRVEPAGVVALATGAGPELVVGMLAALKSGRPFLALDPRNPDDRTSAILAASHTRLLLTGPAPFPAGEAGAGLPELRLELLRTADPPRKRAWPAPHPDAAVCIFYTSGSTGRPKGAVFTAGPLLNYTLAMIEEFGLSPQDRILQVAALGFDVLIEEVLPTLAVGAAVVLTSAPVLTGDVGLSRVIRQLGITGIELTTAYWHEWVADLAANREQPPASLRFVAIGGERVQPRRLAQWARFGTELVHVYGLTEAVVTSTVQRDLASTAGGPAAPIGRPLPNIRCYVLDDRLQPVPPGVPGELYLGGWHGMGLARGYLDQPALTAQRFVADPLSVEPGARMYRTADVVRRTVDGVLEFIGRSDLQVKIRGFRVEPAEIEAALAALDQVDQAAVVAVGDGAGKRLVACLVAAPDHTGRLDPDELRAAVSATLPDYMVPAVLLELPALPLTANGKFDRAPLVAIAADHLPAIAAGGSRRSPATEQEALLSALYADILGVADVSPDDDFFALGGHSLLAVRLVNRVRAATGVDLGVTTVFHHSVVARLAERLATAGPGSVVAEPEPDRFPADGDALSPLSAAQSGLWFIDRLQLVTGLYNMPVLADLTGELDLAALRAAVADVVARHEPLRTIVVEVDGVPHRRVLTGSAAHVPVESIDVGTGAADAAEVAARAGQPFDLSRELPIRVTVLSRSPQRHTLLVVFHHLAVDGAAVPVFSRELGTAYAARVAGSSPAWEPLPVGYGDYARRRQHLLGEPTDPGSRRHAHLEYWRGQLAGAPAELVLPLARLRPSAPSHRGGTIVLDLPAGLHVRLADLARSRDTTLFMVLHAALAAVLTRLGAGTDLVIGTVTAGRDHPDAEHLVGLFLNPLVLRTDTSDDPTLDELLARVRAADLAAYAHQELPFDELVGAVNPPRHAGRHPLFQVVLTLEEETFSALDLPGVTSRLRHPTLGLTKFDLTVQVIAGADGGLRCAIDYARDLFDAADIDALAQRFARMLRAFAADTDQRLAQVDVLSPAERQQILGDWNATPDPAVEDTLPTLFAATARRNPDAVAIAAGGTTLSYRELDRASAALARRLAGAGVAAESTVALLLERSPDVLLASLAAVRAGGCYLPLSAVAPLSHSLAIVEQAEPVAIVVHAATAGHPLLAELAGIIVVDLDEPEQNPADPAQDQSPAQDQAELDSAYPDQLACIIFTSGSTGRPKGVAVSHRAIAALVADRCWPEGSHRAVLLHAPHTFDASTYEVWLPLLTGGRSVVAPPAVPDPVALGRLIADQEVTAALFTPGLFNAMAEHALDDLGGLTLAWTGGDTVPSAAVERLLSRHPGLLVASAWGTTETTVISSWNPLRAPYAVEESVAAGRPMDNTRLYLLNDALQPTPPGVPGEAYIGGIGLARGYHGRPGPTAERFVADPFSPIPGARMYRTGDILRWRSNGVLAFVGRADDQVKIRGFRVEPAEVEAALAAAPTIAQVAVVATGDPGAKRLVAFVVPTATGPDYSLLTDLRTLARAALPEYLVPATFVPVDSLPQTPHGKIDRAALAVAAAEAALPASRSDREPATDTERQLCALFAEVLGLPRVGVGDDFFACGGHSLLVARLVNRIRAELGTDLPLAAVFDAGSPAALAVRVDELAVTEQPSTRPVLRPRRERLP